jgi:hypothetical protein
MNKILNNLFIIFMSLYAYNAGKATQTGADVSVTTSLPGSTTNCFYDTIGNILDKLQKNIQTLEEKCNQHPHKGVDALIAAGKALSTLESYKGQASIPDTVYQAVLDSLVDKSWTLGNQAQKLVDDMRNGVSGKDLDSDFANSWDALNFDLEQNTRDEFLPTFYKDNIWSLIRYQRQQIILSALFKGDDLNKCLPPTYSYITSLTELFTMVYDNYKPDYSKCKDETIDLTLDPYYLETGIAFTFWSYQHMAKVEPQQTVFEGYANNQQLYEYTVYVDEDDGLLYNKITIAGKEMVFPSDADCAENVFGIVVFQKNCDSYKFMIHLRFLSTDKVWEYEQDLTTDQVENVKFNFIYTSLSNMYKNFEYTPDRELALMAAGTSIEKQQELLDNADLCYGEDPKPDPNCLYLTPTGCLVCQKPTLLVNGKCISDCLPGTYKNGNTCSDCDKTCKTCHGPLPSDCDTCDTDFVWDLGYCKNVCPSNKMPDADGKCQECTVDCLFCWDDTTCAKCNALSFLWDGKCTDTCPPGTFPTYNPNECDKCSSGCVDCTNSDNCKKCIDGLFVKNGYCTPNCGDGYYANKDDGQCYKCIDNCKQCPDDKSCDICNDSFFKDMGICTSDCQKGEIPVNGVCIPCDDKNCLTCDAKDTGKCITCDKPYVLKDGKCVSECGDFWYFSVLFDQCYQCPNNCLKCDETKCYSCPDNLVLVEDKECRSVCPDGSVKIGSSCVKCTDPISCKGCNAANLDICTDCYLDNWLEEGKCVPACDKGYYQNWPQCSKCQDHCAKCSNGYSCDDCEIGWFWKNGQCVDDCGKGYTVVDGKCTQCTVTYCDKCDVSADKCEHCTPNKYLYNNRCEDLCPDFTFPTPNYGCDQCKTDCKKCVDSTSCDGCVDGKVLMGNDCVPKCADGWRDVKGICQKCPEDCITCDEDLENCTSCPDGYTLLFGGCFLECPEGNYKYFIGDKEQCVPCKKPCLSCEDENTCDKCDAPFKLYDGVCDDECPKGTVDMGDGTCEDCEVTHCTSCTIAKDECVDCDDGFWLFNGICQDFCPDGTFPINKECHNCTKDCKICSAPDSCDVCKSGTYNKEGQCVPECGDGWAVLVMPDQSKCVQCSTDCKTCLPQDPKTCTSCYKPEALYQGDCRGTCPDGTIMEEGDNGLNCDLCGVKDCKRCPTVDSCDECWDAFWLWDNSCSPTPCDNGYTTSPDGKKECIKCQVPDCKNCPPTNTKDCDICNDSFWLLYTNICTKDCPVGYYQNPLTQACEKCSEGCLDCSDNKNCRKCDSFHYLLNGICVEECVDGYTPVGSNCEKCQVDDCQECLKGDPRYCIVCDKPFLLKFPMTLDNTCVTDCGEALFPDWDGVCKKCPYQCKDCDNEWFCKECYSPFILDDDDQTCTDHCPDKSVAVGKDCKHCQTTDPKCDKCDPADLTQCTDCADNWKLLDNICYEVCPPGYYPEQNICKQCVQGCDECSNSKTCDYCSLGWVLYEGVCHKQCPTGYYEDNRECFPCTANCKQCPNAKGCDICEDDFFKTILGLCTNDCGDYFYIKDGTDCDNCGDHCIKCNNPSDCIICQAGFYKKNGACVDDCLDGYYVNGDSCEKCTDSCKTCPNGTCNECIPPKVLSNGSCIDQCLPGTYEDNGKCNKCSDMCSICDSFENCKKCDDPYVVLPTGECGKSCDSGFTVIDGICQKCDVPDCKTCDTKKSGCDDCEFPFNLWNDKCYNVCPDGTYAGDDNKCHTCTYGCKTCKSADSCIDCIDNWVHNPNSQLCENQCDDGYVQVGEDCEKCLIPDCLSCEPWDPSICIKCDKGQVLRKIIHADGSITQECAEDCGDYFYKDAEENCQKCTDGCRVCNPLTCEICEKGKLLFDGECVDRCDLGYVERNGECIKCTSPNCDECDNINTGICYKCNKNYVLKGTECDTDCGDWFYATFLDERGECKDCKDECKVCHDPNTCETCADGFYHKDNDCVKDCGENYVLIGDTCFKCVDPNCKVCQKDLNTCDDCYSPFFNQPNKLCQPTCDSGFYADIVDYKCKQCTDPNCIDCAPQDQCKKCEFPFVLLNGQCKSECPQGWIADKSNECHKCADEDCKICWSPDKGSCDECFEKWLWGGECNDVCPDGTYPGMNKTCESCKQPLCLQCTSDGCIKCMDGFYVENGFCVDDCDKGQIDVDGKCVPCEADLCNKCQKDDPYTCIDCYPYFLFDGACWDEGCKPGWYKVGTECMQCDDSCETCSDGTRCDTCVSPKLFDKYGKCVDHCDAGFFDFNGQCTPCNDPIRCSVCSKDDPSTCIECSAPYVLINGKCQDKCPLNTWDNNGKCESCSDYCSVCNSSTDCQTCTAPKVLYEKQCIDFCPDGTANVFGKCTQCTNTKCKKCCAANLNSCEDCWDPLWLFNFDCVDSCPKGWYEQDKHCNKCPSLCEECTQTTCICKTGYYKDDTTGNCVTDCPDGTVPRNGECIACADKNCLHCSAHDLTQCIQCNDITVLWDDRCITTCPDGYRKDGTTCTKCPENCKNCDENGCNECYKSFYFLEGTNSCVTCNDPYLIVDDSCVPCKVDGCLKCATPTSCDTCNYDRVKYNDKCPTNCPDGMFKENNECQFCSEKCAECSNKDSCDRCIPGYLNFNGQCVDKCDDGWVPNDKDVCIKCSVPDCKVCPPSNPEICDICMDGAFKELGICKRDCDSGYFKIDGECHQCPADCKECDKDHCITCLYKELNGVCVDVCPIGTYDDGYNCLPCKDTNCDKCDPTYICHECNKATILDTLTNTCVTVCDDGWYASDDRKCTECTKGCKKCNADECITCFDNLYLQDGTCVNPCKPEFTNVNNICVPCSDNKCNACLPEKPDQCTDCSPLLNYKLTCVDSCPKGTYPINGQCKDCDPSCATCSTPDKCDSCHTGFFLDDGQCKNHCPDGKTQFGDTCVPCNDSKCKSCTDKCIECFSPYILQNNECREDCTKGYYPDGTKCSQCPDSCADCISPDKCTECKPGFFYQSGKCTQYCDGNTYQDCKTNQCLPCDSSCDKCFGSSNEECMNCAEGFFKDGKACVAPSQCRVGTYPDTILKQCDTCKIPFCLQCSSATTCKSCQRGFQLDNGKCVQSHSFQNIFTSSQLVSLYIKKYESSKLTYSFSSDLKGIAVGGTTVSFCFWIKRLKNTTKGNIFYTSNSSNGVSIGLETDDHVKCNFFAIDSEGDKVDLQTVDCSYLARQEWTHFLLNYQKNGDSTGILRVTSFGQSWSADLHADAEDVITKETVLNFYRDGNNYDAFDVANFNVLDFYPTEAEIANVEANNKPDDCDFMCSTCDGVCHKCANGDLLDDARCPAGYIPVKQQSSLSTEVTVSLRDKTSRRNFSSDRFGVSFFMYVKNVESSHLAVTSLYYDTFDETFNTDNQLLDITIANKKLVLNGEHTFSHSDLQNKKWYLVSIAVSDDYKAKLTLRALDYSIDYKEDASVSNLTPKVYDDLLFLIGGSWEANKFDITQGSTYDYRFWINNAQGDDEFESHFNSEKCPDHCIECTENFTCANCEEGYEVDSNGNCKDQDLKEGTQLVDKISIWTNESSTMIYESITFSKVSFSIWLRKKRQSLGTGSFTVISAVDTNTKSEYPLLTEQLLTGFHSEYSLNFSDNTEATFEHDYSNEIHNWVHAAIIVDFDAKSIKYNVQDGDHEHLKNGVWDKAFDAIKVGDDFGKEINTEFAKVTVYDQLFTLDNINKIRENKPQDCDPACLNCDYNTGICLSCDVEDTLTNVYNCNLFLKGFASSNLYNKKTYDDLTDSNQFSTSLSEVFNKDVNSLDYSIIGWFRILDLDTFKEDGVYDMFSLNNYAQGSIMNRGAELIGVQVHVTNGTPELFWVVNDDTQKFFPFEPQPTLSTNWILIHAGISVTEKSFKFAYWMDGNKSETSSQALTVFPQKLQETGTLHLYSVGFDIPANYKLGNGSFSDFYMIPNSGFNDILMDIWMDKHPGEDPACPDGCAKCYNISGTAMCVSCENNFKLVNYACEAIEQGTYNILFTEWTWTNSLRYNSFELPKSVFDKESYSVTFWIRRSFVSDGKSNILLSTEGYSLSGVNSGKEYSLQLQMGKDVPVKIATLDVDDMQAYIWYGVSLSFYADRTIASVKNVDHSTVGKTTIPNGSEFLSSFDWELSPDVDIANAAVINKEVDYPVLPAPNDQSCEFYCDLCVNAVCKSCQYGSYDDGSCYEFSLFTLNRYSDGDNNDKVVDLENFVGGSKRLRENKFTLTLTVEASTTDTSFRVFKLSNLDSDYETDYQVSNFLSLSYNQVEGKWLLSISNRSLGYSKQPITLEAVYKIKPTESKHWIGIAYDGQNGSVQFYAYNNKESTTQAYMSEIPGSSEFLTNFSKLYLNKDLTKSTTYIGYNNIRIFPSKILDLNFLSQMAESDLGKEKGYCNEACITDCADGQCAATERVTEPIDLTDMTTRNPESLYSVLGLDSLYMFRHIRDAQKWGRDSWTIGEYLITYNLDLGAWSTSKYLANSNMLLIVGDVEQDVNDLRMGDLIPENIFKYAHVVLQARGNVLRMYFNGNSQDLQLTHDLTEYNNLYFSMYIESENGFGKVFVTLDDNTYSLDWGYATSAPLNLDTMVYTNPATTSLLVNAHVPRFDYVFEKFYNEDAWTSHYSRTNTCEAVTEHCEKCLSNLKENSNGCWKCNDNNFLTEGNTCYPSSNQ